MNLSFLIFFAFSLTALYFIFSVITAVGTQKKISNHFAYKNNKPLVSVIVVARNEENTLQECLASLREINYPQNKLEFILVNDRSSDNTLEIMRNFARSVSSAQVINSQNNPFPYTGKVNGLIQGVKASKGEILFFTDADCIVLPTWVESTICKYDESTGMIGGFLMLENRKEHAPLFSRLQSLDWIYFTAIGSGWANLGHPLSIFGNNFSIRRKLYDRVGGFESIGNHITEDFALARNVYKKTNFSIRIVADDKNYVTTRPVKTLKEFFIQRKRWAIGGRSHGLLGFFLMTIAFLTNLFFLISMIVGNFPLSLFIFTVLLVSDIILLYYPLKILKRLDLFLYILPYKLFYIGYTLLFAPVLLFARNVQWKSTPYTVGVRKERNL